MKKALTLLMAAAMVIGFTGMSAAQDTCLDPLNINRGCETDQQNCYPFDYENIKVFDEDFPNYCTVPTGKETPKAIFSVCDCEFASDLGVGDVVDVRLEILVNGSTGNNGAYWAQHVDADGADSDSSENVRIDAAVAGDDLTAQEVEDNCLGPDASSGIGLKTAASETQACAYDCFGSAFVGDFVYKGWDADGNAISTSSIAADSGTCNAGTYTIIEPALDQELLTDHGYMIQEDDTDLNNSEWAIDIPYIWIDQDKISEGDTISVEICLTPASTDGEPSSGSICGGCGCCETFELGTITCCEAGTSYSLVYPYATPMDDANWWYGMVIINESDTAGEANITIHEQDGDTESIVATVDAHDMFVKNSTQLSDEFGEDIGDSRAYFTVDTDFSADGFFYIGNYGRDGEAMGYLPRK